MYQRHEKWFIYLLSESEIEQGDCLFERDMLRESYSPNEEVVKINLHLRIKFFQQFYLTGVYSWQD